MKLLVCPRRMSGEPFEGALKRPQAAEPSRMSNPCDAVVTRLEKPGSISDPLTSHPFGERHTDSALEVRREVLALETCDTRRLRSGYGLAWMAPDAICNAGKPRVVREYPFAAGLPSRSFSVVRGPRDSASGHGPTT